MSNPITFGTGRRGPPTVFTSGWEWDDLRHSPNDFPMRNSVALYVPISLCNYKCYYSGVKAGIAHKFDCPICNLRGSVSQLAKPYKPFALYECEGLGRGRGWKCNPVPVDADFRNAYHDRLQDGVISIARAGALDMTETVANLYANRLLDPRMGVTTTASKTVVEEYRRKYADDR